MLTRQNEKLVYKMYKKGRFWVFAGIAVATWNLQTLTGQAATETTSASTTSETSASSQLNESQVSLSHSSSSATSTSSTESASTSTSSTEATKADATSTSSTDDATSNSQINESDNKSEITTSSSSSTDSQGKQTTDSSSDSKDVTTSEPDKGSSSDSSVTDSKTTPVTTGDDVNQEKATPASTTQPETPVKQPATTEPETTSETTDVTGNEVTTNNQLDGENLNTNLLTLNTNYLATNLMSNAIQAAGTQKLLSRSNLLRSVPTVVVSGVWNTSAWSIDSDGVLTIGAGDFGDSVYSDAWYSNEKLIKKVIITGPVVAGKSLARLFFNASSLTSVTGLAYIDTHNVTDMSYIFSGTKVADFTGIETWDTSHVTNFMSTFASTSMSDADAALVQDWDVSRVTIFNSMFQNITTLTTLDLSHWKVGANVVAGTGMTMGGFTLNDSNLTSITLGDWDTSNVTQTTNMFVGTGLESLDLSGLDLRKVTGFIKMLGNMSALKSLTLGANTRLRFYQANLDIWQDASLPDVPQNASYTGKWVSTTDSSKVYTSAELMALYSSSTADIPSDVTTYVWQATPSSSVLEAKDVTVIAGPQATWQAQDSVTTLKDAAGKDILATANVNQLVTTQDVVDPTTPGVYDVTLTYVDDANTTRTATVKVTVVASQSQLIGQPVSVNQGSKTWVAGDSVDATQSLDATGQAFTAAEVAKVTGTTLDTSVAGAQTVTLTYTDSAGNVRTAAVQVTVIASQAGLTTQDVKIVQGNQASWHVLDHVTGATNFDETPATDLTILAITASTTPDLTQVGTTPITLTYTDSEGNVHTYQVNAVVVANNADFTVNPITVIAGPNTNWSIADSIGTVTDTTGNTVTDLSNITANQQPDLMTPGTYNVVLTYTDDAGYTHQKTAIVNVVATQADVKVNNSTIVLGPKTTWQAKDNLTAVIKANGDSVSADDVILENTVKVTANVMSVMYSYLRTDGTTVTVSGQVDLSQAGDNEITYTYTDSQGNTKTKTAIVTVVASQANLDAKDATVIAGPKASYNATDQLTLAKDELGQDVDASAVTVGGDKVDVTTPGTYQVTYHYVDGAGNAFDKTITVNVVKSQANLDAKNTTIIAGPNANWQLSDNVNAVTNEVGQAVGLQNVKVDGQVDPTTAGTYPLTLTYTDAQGNQIKKTVTVTVANSQAGIQAVDRTITLGTAWQAADNFVSATDALGQVIDLSQLSVTDNVDPTTVGTYTVTYQYTDSAGNVKTTVVTVSVTDPIDENGDGDTINPTPDENGNGNPDQPATDQDTAGKPVKPGQTNPATGQADPAATPTEMAQGATITPLVAHPTTTGQADQLATTGKAATKLTTATKSTATSKDKLATLPQTNETNRSTTVLGSILLAATGLLSLLGLGRKRRHMD